MAVPLHADARFRIQPGRPRDLPRNAGRAPRLHGLQPQPVARPGRPAVQPRPPRRRCEAYFGNAGATQALPIDRLRHMNPLAIELYRRYKVDIVAEPLEFAVNNQHMNGGIVVDTWGRSSLAGCLCSRRGCGHPRVTRPGGSALNAGQVFGTRVAEHIGASGRAKAVAGADSARSRDGVVAVLRCPEAGQSAERSVVRARSRPG